MRFAQPLASPSPRKRGEGATRPRDDCTSSKSALICKTETRVAAFPRRIPAVAFGLFRRPALERIPVMLNHFSGVMAGFVPAIHALLAEDRARKTWMPATSAGMTVES